MALFIGLISGTSMDAIDAALLELDGTRISLRDSAEIPYPSALRARLEKVVRERAATIDELGALDTATGVAFAEAALSLLPRNGLATTDITAIGSHGQTVGHGVEGVAPYTLQIGNPHVIAWRTRICTVANFRAMDIAAGGQGAPLVPGFHRQLFHRNDRDVAVVNIGGISNLSLIPQDPADPLLGFDCGPGNTLMDLWAQRHLGVDFDAGGAWAAQGTPDRTLLRVMKDDAYFSQRPPKSTGREYFHGAWLERQLSRLERQPTPVDVQATLAILTAECITDALVTTRSACNELIVCGGGAKNETLMHALRVAAGAARTVVSTDNSGWPSSAIEASTFAWLAWRRLAGLPGNEPSVTGATASVLLGVVHEAG